MSNLLQEALSLSENHARQGPSFIASEAGDVFQKCMIVGQEADFPFTDVYDIGDLEERSACNSSLLVLDTRSERMIQNKIMGSILQKELA